MRLKVLLALGGSSLAWKRLVYFSPFPPAGSQPCLEGGTGAVLDQCFFDPVFLRDLSHRKSSRSSAKSWSHLPSIPLSAGRGRMGRSSCGTKRAQQMYGYDTGEILGKAGWDILHTPENIATGLPAMNDGAVNAWRAGGKDCLPASARNGQRFLALAVQTPPL